jgi:hypothetical protein
MRPMPRTCALSKMSRFKKAVAPNAIRKQVITMIKLWTATSSVATWTG